MGTDSALVLQRVAERGSRRHLVDHAPNPLPAPRGARHRKQRGIALRSDRRLHGHTLARIHRARLGTHPLDPEGESASLAGAALGLVGGGTGIAVKSVTTAAANLERVAVVETTAKLTAKADDVHAVLDPIASKQRTTAALSTKEGTSIVGGGARDLNPAQVTVATQDGAQVARSSGAHAEVTVVEYAREKGLSPQVIVAARNFCDRCTSFLESEGATIVGPRTARWDK